MIHEPKPAEAQKARRLFAPLSFHASCTAVLDGMNPGRILVDDPGHPTAGFVLSPEAAYLSGDADNMRFCAGLEAYLRDAGNLGVSVWHLDFVVSSDRWMQRLNRIAGADGVESTARRHYLCSPGDDFRALPPPEGAILRQIDEDLLNRSTFCLPDHIHRWIRNNWGSYSHFLEAGFGVVTTCGTEVVSWSVADCIAEEVCEIGIHTSPEWRRRGMGSFTANAAVQHAFSKGLRHVGWHCPEENVASRHTAERAGLALERKYDTYRIRDPRNEA
jgi:RimJ/RimL family protein N-acetyltransferase